MNPHQSGFRPGHSITTAVCKVVNDIICALDKKESCTALCIDLSKAFDTVDHAMLIEKSIGPLVLIEMHVHVSGITSLKELEPYSQRDINHHSLSSQRVWPKDQLLGLSLLQYL